MSIGQEIGEIVFVLAWLFLPTLIALIWRATR